MWKKYAMAGGGISLYEGKKIISRKDAEEIIAMLSLLQFGVTI